LVSFFHKVAEVLEKVGVERKRQGSEGGEEGLDWGKKREAGASEMEREMGIGFSPPKPKILAM
jgi:hypothetical protein